MKNTNNILLATTLILTAFLSPVRAQKTSKKTNGTDIALSANAAHIAGIAKDTLAIITGSTYRYDVDTPEDKGLVSTNATVAQLLPELAAKDGSTQRYVVTDASGAMKNEGDVVAGDHLVVTSPDGKATKIYPIITKPMALAGQLSLVNDKLTADTKTSLTLYFKAGQRSPDASVNVYLPKGINATMDNTTVNVIGRGDIKLSGLAAQSIGRTGTHYSYTKVGDVVVTGTQDGGQLVTFTHLDLRPDNGIDLKLTFNDVRLKNAGKYPFRAQYTASQPERLTSPGTEQAVLVVSNPIADLERMVDHSLQYRETADTYTHAVFKWSAVPNANAKLMQSADKGKTWSVANAHVDLTSGKVGVSGLLPDREYAFKLWVENGVNKGESNIARFYSGKLDIGKLGVNANGTEDNTDKINESIGYLNRLGGGTLYFGKGVYSVRTVHLKSNVFLYIDKSATLRAIKENDAPETTWFCDKKYRSGLSPTDIGPYTDPENYMTKQDVGHQYFHNAMFSGERLDNVKIIGNGRITGNGNLVNGDKVMNNTPDNRADKIFALKLCTNVEIGGIYRAEDLWYDADKDAPYYMGKSGAKPATDNMLNIDRSGHFVLLATGTDGINIHDTYMGKQSVSNTRDIYDFMGCSNVDATNIYVTTTSDDIIKLGSDCSLGFTRPAHNYKVRNIIGDTNCNLVQLGSETADDIMDVYVDNIYILGANKAGFSISANDGAHIKNVQLNSGFTGPIHSRSKMYRCTTPFFVSISNRGRVIGADAGKYTFTEVGKKHNELLIKNVNIGAVEDIKLNGVDVYEVYSGSSYSGKRWKPYDGTQRKSSPIIAGYKLPDNADVEGGLDFKLPNGKHTGYIKNITLNDVNILVKGGNAAADTAATPPEMGVGQYNVGDLKIQPSYGLWARHVKGLTVTNSTFNYEKRDSRYGIFFDDVVGANILSVKIVRSTENPVLMALKNSSGLNMGAITWFNDKWGIEPQTLMRLINISAVGLMNISPKK
jgi:polygalacturonase